MHPKCLSNLLLTVTIHIYLQLGEHIVDAVPVPTRSNNSEGLQRSNQTSHIHTQHIEQQQQQQQINQTLNTARTNTTVNSPAEIQLEENPSSIYKNEQSNSNEVDPDQTQIHTDYLSVEVQRGLSDDVDESIKDDSESSEEIPATTEPCPVNFLRHKDSCYHITKPSQMTWGVADTYCKMYDSKLVEIDSKSEQNFIESLIKLTKDNLINAALEKGENIGAEFDFAYWIGATNRAGQGQWKWESTGEPLNFQMWVSKWSGWVDEIESPSCALIDTSESHQWMFWPCAKDFFMTGKRHTVQTKIGFICEKESKRARKNKNQSKKDKRRRKQRRKGRRNFHRRHWRKYLV